VVPAVSGRASLLGQGGPQTDPLIVLDFALPPPLFLDLLALRGAVTFDSHPLILSGEHFRMLLGQWRFS